jgi:hypothetical protein
MSVKTLMHDMASANFPNSMQCPGAAGSHILCSGTHWTIHTTKDTSVMTVRNTPEARSTRWNHCCGNIRRYRNNSEILIVYVVVK